MSSWIRGASLLAAAAIVSSGVAEAGLFRCLFHHGHSCRHSRCRPADCCVQCFQPPQVCTCTTVRPVVETHLREERFVTYRDVARTQFRQETCVEKVPVTTFDDVTVDAGQYQTVWIPNLVTQKVARTVLQERVSQRTVPFQVLERVPEVSTRLVPQQSVRYVQQTQVVATPGCNTCGTGPTPMMPFAPQPFAPRPVAPPLVPSVAPSASLSGQFSSAVLNGPTPDPRFVNSSISSRYNDGPAFGPPQSPAAYDDPLGDYQIAPRSHSGGGSGHAASKKFVPAPSAATVWHSRPGFNRP